MSDEIEPRVPDDYPPMLFKFPRRVTADARARWQSEVALAVKSRRMFAFDDDVRVYQLVGGRWRLIK